MAQAHGSIWMSFGIYKLSSHKLLTTRYIERAVIDFRWIIESVWSNGFTRQKHLSVTGWNSAYTLLRANMMRFVLDVFSQMRHKSGNAIKILSYKMNAAWIMWNMRNDLLHAGTLMILYDYWRKIKLNSRWLK